MPDRWIMGGEPQVPDRVQALIDAAVRRRTEREGTRAVLRERRRHGLARRHAAKAARAGVRPTTG